MPRTGAIARLLNRIAHEADSHAALDIVVNAALETTGGRNAVIARLNDIAGSLEIRYGVGPEWQEVNEHLRVGVETGEGIVAYVAATGKNVISGNVAKEPLYRQIFSSTVSEIAVPVRDEHGRIRGVLNVESERPDAFDDVDLTICEGLASLAAIVMERDESRKREEALIEIGTSVERALNEEQVLEGVIRTAGEVLHFQAFSVFLLDRFTDEFVLKGSVSSLRDKIGVLRYKAGEGCTGWVAEHGEPILLDNPQTDPRWRGLHVEFPSEQISSFLAVPVISRGKVIGVIRVLRRVSENKYLENRFTESDQRIMIAVASQLAIGLENVRNIDKMVRSERMAAWGELSAKSSHMMGNRLFALKGDVNELGYLLQDEELNREALLDLNKSLTVSVSRIEEILQEFRDFLTATELKLAWVNPSELVRETVDEVFPKRTHVKLVLSTDPHLPETQLDERRVRRMVSELVENALNFTQEGFVRVSTGFATDEDIQRTDAPRNKGYAKIEIEDSGPGVPREQKSRIFEPFFSSRVKGMGLGLSIVKGVVDAHGGSIVEAGEEGHGAKFVILFPLLERSKTET